MRFLCFSVAVGVWELGVRGEERVGCWERGKGGPGAGVGKVEGFWGLGSMEVAIHCIAGRFTLSI